MKHLVAVLMALMLLFGVACAEGYDLWALCENYVNIRAKPSSHSEAIGYLTCGDGIETDGKVKGRWIHCVNLSCEVSDGWVFGEYLTDDQPTFIDADYKIVSSGRVALRKSIDGKRKSWLKPDSTVHVLWMSDEWTLTTKGYIRTEFVEASE